MAALPPELTYGTIERTAVLDGLSVMGGVHEDGTTILLLGPGREFWRIFKVSAEMQDGAPDPVDRWSARVFGRLANHLKAEPLLPFGGPRWTFLNGLACLTLAGGLGAMLFAHARLNREGAPTQNPWHWAANVSILVGGLIGTLFGVTAGDDAAAFGWFRFGRIACLAAAMPGFLASFRVRGATPE